MKRSEIRREYIRVNRNFETAYMPKVQRALHVTVIGVITDLRSGGYSKAISDLNKSIGSQSLSRVVSELYKVVGSRHARMTHSRLLREQQKGFGFNAIWTKFVEDYLKRFLLDKITFRVAETLRDKLLKVLNAGIVAGLGVDGMIKELKDWPYERFMAARIVRTEVNRAANVGAKAQSETSEYEQQKIWISVQDFRTRGNNPKDHANHVALNGTTIDSGDEFVDPRNGDRLKFPGDPDASAESTVNCRCSAAFILKRDANGNPIPKRKSTTVIYPGQVRRPQILAI